MSSLSLAAPVFAEETPTGSTTIVKQVDNAAKDTKTAAEKAAKEAQTAAEKAAKEAQNQLDKAAKEAKIEADKAAKTLQLEADKVARDAAKKVRMEEKAKLITDKQTLQEQKKGLDAELVAIKLKIDAAEKAGDTQLILQLKTQFEAKKAEIAVFINKLKEIRSQLRLKEISKYTEQQIKDAEKLAKELKQSNKNLEVLGLDSIIANGADVTLDTPPVIDNGRTLIPARAIAEAYGATVQWNPTTKEVTIKKDQTTIVITIGSLNATVNGKTVTLDVPAKTINNRTLLPLRFIVENLGLKVDWDDSSKTIEITPPTTITTTGQITAPAITTTPGQITTPAITTTPAQITTP